MLSISPINNRYYNNSVSFKANTEETKTEEPTVDYSPIKKGMERLYIESEEVIPKEKQVNISVENVNKPFSLRLTEWFIGLFSKSQPKEYKKLPVDENGNTVLHNLCASGELKTVKKFIKKHPDLDINQVNNSGHSYMDIAMGYNRTEIVNYLAGLKSIKLDVIDKYGYNGIHYLCRDGFATAIRRYIKTHPDFDVNQRTKDGLSYIRRTMKWSSYREKVLNVFAEVKSMDLSIIGDDGYNDMHHLCRGGYTEAVRRYIKTHPDFDVNQRTKDGLSYIELARRNDRTDIVNILAGIKSIDLCGKHDDLYDLCRDGYTEAVRRYVKNHKHINENKLASYMSCAQMNRHYEILKILAKIA